MSRDDFLREKSIHETTRKIFRAFSWMCFAKARKIRPIRKIFELSGARSFYRKVFNAKPRLPTFQTARLSSVQFLLASDM